MNISLYFKRYPINNKFQLYLQQTPTSQSIITNKQLFDFNELHFHFQSTPINFNNLHFNNKLQFHCNELQSIINFNLYFKRCPINNKLQFVFITNSNFNLQQTPISQSIITNRFKFSINSNFNELQSTSIIFKQ